MDYSITNSLKRIRSFTSCISFQLVILTIHYYSIEESPSCVYDAIIIKDGPDEFTLETFCGDSDGLVTIVSFRTITFDFISDSSATGMGFNATWEGINLESKFSQPKIASYRHTTVSLMNNVSFAPRPSTKALQQSASHHSFGKVIHAYPY